MAIRCPICNNSSTEVRFYGPFCERCASRKLRERLPECVEVARCRVCGRIRTREGMRRADRTGLQSVIASRLRGYSARLTRYEEGEEGSAAVEVTESSGGQTLATEAKIRVEYEKMTCDQCYKKIGGYYEAVFQLRGDAERVERFAARVSRYFEAKGGFVARTERVEGGLDLFLSSKRLANAFISERRIVVNASYTLQGLKNGRRVYRNTYAVRL